MMHAVSDIHDKEGMKGFYRGLVPSVTQIMPYMGLVFLSYDMLCTSFEWLRSQNVFQKDHKMTQDMICGSLASIIGKVGVFPLDTVRKRLQVQGPHRTDYIISSIPCYTRESTVACLRAIIQTEGFLALYKGIVPGLLKVAPAGAVNFLVFEWAKNVIVNLKESGVEILPDSPVPANIS
ncbi:mitochondrial thiamine pyrophosphate transporter [Apophysomyces ossiformis]|uniref:Mitochondrial thiamine pyrophosphate transporter n=1 Tax=Apophysomyces ossiformis TaxID=679940 RepID=A0A8H7ELY5_9FUNG|nr:mitochondrial thiamine pyrophosphate transporter [Apophysomyces ossiformis]